MSGLAMAPFDAGLTNQKFAILGLALRARAEGRTMVLPELVDFVSGRANPRIAYDAVLDSDAIATHLSDLGVALAPHRDPSLPLLDPAPLFVEAATAITDRHRARDADGFRDLCRLLAAMRPPPDPAIARSAVGAIHLQLRIEGDWRRYVDTELAARFPDEALYLDHRAIRDRITAALGPGQTLYVTCNRADLPVSTDEITADFGRDHHRLLFGADLAPSPGRGPLADAASDFALALSLPRRIGHSRSTFFNALSLTRHGEGLEDEAWLYNVRGPRLKRRFDHGALVRPWAATQAV